MDPMKFSLAFLLFCMLVASLTVNIWNNQRLIEVAKKSSLELQSAIDADQFMTRRFADQIQVYDRAHAAFEKRKRLFAAARPDFEKVARKYSVLKVEDTSRIHLVEMEEIAPTNGYHEHIRVWLPDSPEFKLQFGFHRNDNSFVRSRELRSSRIYEPSEVFEVPLPAGESSIELLGDLNDGVFSVKLSVDKQIVHEVSRKVPEGERVSRSIRGISMRDCVSLKAETRTILSLNAGGGAAEREQMSIQLLVTATDKEANDR
jgi:hypothetical protein